MASIYIHECDICKKVERKQHGIPNDWFEFEYQYCEIGGNGNSLSFLTCSFKCYITLVDRCLHWSLNHGNVYIAGMTPKFARNLLNGVNLLQVQEDVIFDLEKNKIKSEKIKARTQELEEDFPKQPEIQEAKSEPNGKVISTKITSNGIALDWLINFANQNNDSKLLKRAQSLFENDNIITYDQLYDQEVPTIPLIRYKDHYTLFLFEGKLNQFEQLKASNQAQ